jgi:hypothetical protein
VARHGAVASVFTCRTPCAPKRPRYLSARKRHSRSRVFDLQPRTVLHVFRSSLLLSVQYRHLFRLLVSGSSPSSSMGQFRHRRLRTCYHSPSRSTPIRHFSLDRAPPGQGGERTLSLSEQDFGSRHGHQTRRICIERCSRVEFVLFGALDADRYDCTPGSLPGPLWLVDQTMARDMARIFMMENRTTRMQGTLIWGAP